MISILKRLNVFPPRSVLPGGLFNYFHRSVSYLASVRIQPGYRERNSGEGSDTNYEKSHAWMDAKRSNGGSRTILDAIHERSGVHWLHGVCPLYESIAALAASATTGADLRVQRASARAFFTAYNAAINASALRRKNSDRDNRPDFVGDYISGALGGYDIFLPPSFGNEGKMIRALIRRVRAKRTRRR